MSVSKVAVLSMLFTATAMAAQAAPVRRAGEWQTSIDGNPGRVVCIAHDATFDSTTLAKEMAKVPGAKCAAANFSVMGPIIKATLACDINGMHMVTDSVITATGPDAYTTRTHSHTTGAMKLADGRSMSFPDQDMTLVSKRLGACKPGEKTID